MAVRIRMKKQGRKHRPFFRICAVDSRRPRDGRVIEELGTYDPMIPDTDARTVLKGDRIAYWLSVGAQPSDKVSVLIKKYGADGTHLAAGAAAREKLSMPKPKPALKEAADVQLIAEREAAAKKAKAESEAAAAKAGEEEAKQKQQAEAAQAAEAEAKPAVEAEAPAEEGQEAKAEDISTPAEQAISEGAAVEGTEPEAAGETGEESTEPKTEKAE